MKLVLMWSMFSGGRYLTGALVGALIGAAAGAAGSLIFHAVRKSRRSKAAQSLTGKGYRVLYGDDRLGLMLLGDEGGHWVVIPHSGTPCRPFDKSQLSGCELVSRSKSWLTVRIQTGDPANPALELPVALAPRNAAFNQEMNEKARAFLDALQGFCGRGQNGEEAEQDGKPEALSEEPAAQPPSLEEAQSEPAEGEAPSQAADRTEEETGGAASESEADVQE